MDKALRAPRNRTAEMQLIQRLVSQGYTLWTSDRIPLGSLAGFVAKWQHYRLLADPAARAYRKQTGKANTHLILEHRFNVLDADSAPLEPIQWLMLGTPGREGLGDDTAQPGAVLNARHQAQRIDWMGYQLIRQPKCYTTSDGQVRREVTWTWRLPGHRYREWEALLVAAAKARNYASIRETFAVLHTLPMFAGIREQINRLHAETNKVLEKAGGSVLPPSDLPFMTLHKIWAED